MAIDTEQKRKSAATVVSIWNGPSVVPNGVINQADRQHIGWSYSGILAGGGGNIAKVAGVTWANIAKIDGIAKASIAKINGVAI